MILYSTFSAPYLAELVAAEYDLGAPVACRLLRRGFNDHYIVTAGDSRYMLRVCLHDKYWISGGWAPWKPPRAGATTPCSPMRRAPPSPSTTLRMRGHWARSWPRYILRLVALPLAMPGTASISRFW